MIDETIKYILNKAEVSTQDILDDPDLKIEIAKILSERVNIALPSALSEITAYAFINTQYSSSSFNELSSNPYDSTKNTNEVSKCVVCEELIDKIYVTCYVCGARMHINCGYKDIGDKKNYCSEECIEKERQI